MSLKNDMKLLSKFNTLTTTDDSARQKGQVTTRLLRRTASSVALKMLTDLITFSSMSFSLAQLSVVVVGFLLLFLCLKICLTSCSVTGFLILIQLKTDLLHFKIPRHY